METRTTIQNQEDLQTHIKGVAEMIYFAFGRYSGDEVRSSMWLLNPELTEFDLLATGPELYYNNPTIMTDLIDGYTKTFFHDDTRDPGFEIKEAMRRIWMMAEMISSDPELTSTDDYELVTNKLFPHIKKTKEIRFFEDLPEDWQEAFPGSPSWEKGDNETFSVWMSWVNQNRFHISSIGNLIRPTKARAIREIMENYTGETDEQIQVNTLGWVDRTAQILTYDPRHIETMSSFFQVTDVETAFAVVPEIQLLVRRMN